MLVLTRKIDEEIQIGEEIRIKVLGIRGGSVRLGIEAPAAIKILRKELELSPEASSVPILSQVPIQSATERTRSVAHEWSARITGPLACHRRGKVAAVLGAMP